ncbi:ABC transporter substrate-binding protein [Sphingomonas sp. NCPPB 2930]
MGMTGICGSVSKGVTLLLGVFALATAAYGQAPLKNATFDPARLTRDNFYATLEPLARQEGELLLYNSAGSFTDVWRKGLIPRFEARYGVKVRYRDVRNAIANQQLMAVHRVGQDSPADVYFAGSTDNFQAMASAGVIARLDLGALLPNLATVPSAYTGVVFGVPTGGAWPLVHLNQTAIGYDSAAVPPAEVPRTYDDLLRWAEHHPGRFVITSPSKGGAGGGFLYSVARHFASEGECRTRLLDSQQSEASARAWAASDPCLQPVWDYFERLLRVAVIANGNADTLNLIQNGQAWVGTVWEDQILVFQRAKLLPATVRTTLLDSGEAGSGDGLIMTANTRRPAAALLFIDMAFGREFQLWKLQQRASRSPRPDVTQADMRPEDAVSVVPESMHARLSIPINWRAVSALTAAFEDKVLSRR